MAKIAILGFGNIGSGVLEILEKKADSITDKAKEPIEVKYILDIRDFKGHEYEKLFVNNIDVILQDDEITSVVETIGGSTYAYYFVKQCLESKRNVITSNKELVAKKGAELLAIAKKNKVCFLFEASVGGGTPVITPMHQCMSADEITEIKGIVNGTTNFILTKMGVESMSFADALKLAQDKGYAETKDPSDDIDGLDAARKIAILSTIAWGKHVYPENVPASGIGKITTDEINSAKALGYSIKLIAHGKICKDSGKVVCGVEPMLVPFCNQLAIVNDVYNGIMVTGDMLGDVIYYGQGAGKLPTASAIVADIIDIIKQGESIHDTLTWQDTEPFEGMLTDNTPYTYYIKEKDSIDAYITSDKFTPEEITAKLKDNDKIEIAIKVMD